MTPFSRVFSMCLLALCPVQLALSCDDVLGVCLKTSNNPTGALVTSVKGNLAQHLLRAGDTKSYFLVADQHVITAVNGLRVADRDECVAALKNVAGTSFTIDVHNTIRGTTFTYHCDDTNAPNPGNVATPEKHAPGVAHPTITNVVAGSKPDIWTPAPGYVWVNRRNINEGVRWQWNRTHPNYSGIYSSKTEGRWNLQVGFEFVNNVRGDLRTRYVGWDEGGSSDWDFGSGGTDSDPGLSPSFLRQLNNRHSPYNSRGYTGPR